MYRVDLYARVRRACRVKGMSTREASRVFGVDCAHAPPRRPKLGPFTGIIDRILAGDRTSHHEQRHTAKRIFDRLRDEYGFTGGYTIVKDYVRERRLRSREVFVPLVHSPGHAQADFGEAMAVIGGVARKAHFLAFDLPHSDGCFVKAYPAETTEAFWAPPCADLQLVHRRLRRARYDRCQCAAGPVSLSPVLARSRQRRGWSKLNQTHLDYTP